MKRAIVHAAFALVLAFAFTGTAEAKTHRLTKATIIQVQDRLEELGFHPGDHNGKLSKETHKAIAQFQMSLRKKPSGELDKNTLALLTAPSTAKKSVMGRPAAPMTYAQQYTTPYAAPIGYMQQRQPLYQHNMYVGNVMQPATGPRFTGPNSPKY